MQSTFLMHVFYHNHTIAFQSKAKKGCWKLMHLHQIVMEQKGLVTPLQWGARHHEDPRASHALPNRCHPIGPEGVGQSWGPVIVSMNSSQYFKWWARTRGWLMDPVRSSRRCSRRLTTLWVQGAWQGTNYQSAELKSRDGAGNPHTHGVTGAVAGCPGLSWNGAPDILVKECNGVPGEAGKRQ